MSGNKVWSEWWKKKRKNNQDYLIAAENSDIKMVKCLLDSQNLHDLVAEVNYKGLDNWGALHFAANEGRLEVVDFLLSRDGIEKEAESSIMRTAMHLAAIRGYQSILKSLEDAGCNVNAKDFDESTPLHYASEFAHSECLVFMLEVGKADPSIRNKFGCTPWDIAANF